PPCAVILSFSLSLFLRILYPWFFRTEDCTGDRGMHGSFESTGPDISTGKPWYKTLTRYHWFVLFVSALGWLFDCLDQQLFVLARPAAMKDLILDQGTQQLTDQARRLG